MIKSIVKILIAVLLANAIWHVASAYVSYYRFKDAVSELALHPAGKTESQIKDRVVELAVAHDEPLDAESVKVQRNDQHTVVEGNYSKPIVLFPGLEYQLPLSLNVDRFSVDPNN